MEQAILGLLGTLIGASAAIGGVVISQRMAHRAEQERWSREAKLQEYRELLVAFTTAYMTLARIHQMTDEREQANPEFNPVPSDLELESYRALRTRIFVARSLEGENIGMRWTEALENFKRTNDIRRFAERFSSIVDTVTWLATGQGARPKAV